MSEKVRTNMLVRYINTGAEEQLPVGLANSLIKAGMAEEVKKAPEPVSPETPRWSVELYGHLEPKLFIVMRIGNHRLQYGGLPERANHKVTWEGGFRYTSGFGREVPEVILCEYTTRYKNAHRDERLPIEASAPDAANMQMAAALQTAQLFERKKEAALKVPQLSPRTHFLDAEGGAKHMDNGVDAGNPPGRESVIQASRSAEGERVCEVRVKNGHFHTLGSDLLEQARARGAKVIRKIQKGVWERPT